jgi:hypothetical protein
MRTPRDPVHAALAQFIAAVLPALRAYEHYQPPDNVERTDTDLDALYDRLDDAGARRERGEQRLLELGVPPEMITLIEEAVIAAYREGVTGRGG